MLSGEYEKCILVEIETQLCRYHVLAKRCLVVGPSGTIMFRFISCSDMKHHYTLILNKVLMLGSSTQTIIGRPIVPDATVHAVVEEHALDVKELTKLRIADIQGIEKPEPKVDPKPKKAAVKKQEKVAVAA
ncbi:hypothetical protein DKX38_017095 [Salix brachista]|uniref:Large ribosomal subunit protein bL21m n=1 Tax=Salix brachista TaxID=2182728 RepID=A0A5N5KUB1_9ROSI|nr:hypothetical protein DKX38_017095 [Salix brachista]